MSYYQRNGLVERKVDNSPVTEADRAADAYIVEQLSTLTPDIPIVSEEGEKPDVSNAPLFWLVDPLDGTRSFVRGSGFFTVNIGLIGENRLPIAGVIYDPVHRTMYWGGDGKAFRQFVGKDAEQIHVRRRGTNGLTAIVSSHNLNKATEVFLASHGITQHLPCASSIKFCRLAEGAADIYPRFGPTMEWDTAAGQAILEAAGGSVTTPEGTPFFYGKQGSENGNFIACGSLRV